VFKLESCTGRKRNVAGNHWYTGIQTYVFFISLHNLSYRYL